MEMAEETVQCVKEDYMFEQTIEDRCSFEQTIEVLNVNSYYGVYVHYDPLHIDYTANNSTSANQSGNTS